MSTSTLISLAEYLSTSYRPDCDYVDGEARERNVGESEHSILQAAITAWFWNHQREWQIEVRPEQRVQVSPTRFRVPDICLLQGNQPRGPIASVPPLVCIELLSKDDTLRSMRERVNDYLNFGTEHVWILDPAAREAFVCTRTGLNIPTTGQLQVPGTEIFLPLVEIFRALDQTS
jgi:Uma2 family endonuclease